MSALSDLKKAKQYSDARQYDQKHQLIHQLVRESPSEFFIDSEKDGIVGLTHELTGFRIHVPRKVIHDLDLSSKGKESAAAKPLSGGAGLPKIQGGGSGSYMKLPSLYGSMKSELTKATKRVGDQARTVTHPAQKQQQATPAASQLYPATTEYMQKKLQGKPFAYKASELTTSDISKALGYSPGFWYGQDSFSPAAQTRAGNLISGAGLSALGLASIPVLKYLFPERFEGKGRNMAALAVLGGMAAPWLANAPSTFRDIASLGAQSNESYGGKDREDMQARYRKSTGITPYGSNAAVAEGGTLLTNPPGLTAPLAGAEGPSAKKSAYIPMDLQIAKTHLADVTAEQMRRGYVDYGQAAGLMLRASQESNKPWVTVRDLAHAAVGAGAGAVAGTAAAKGIGMFVNMSPTEQKLMQGTGAALGTLINLGKFGF